MAGVRPPLTWSCKRALQVVLYPWEEATQHLGGFSKKLDGFSAVLRFSVYPFSVSGDSWYHRWCDQLLHPPVHTSEGVNSDSTAAWRRVLLTGTVAIFVLINSSETERQRNETISPLLRSHFLPAIRIHFVPLTLPPHPRGFAHILPGFQRQLRIKCHLYFALQSK